MIKGIINNIPKDIKRVAMPVDGIDKGWEVRDSQGHLIWGRQETISGSTPLSFTSGNGDDITSWSLLGNGQQTGMPKPDNPITPTFCGKLVGSDWTIPITCGGQTVPVYLGQMQTVRKVKKLVLTGEENWTEAVCTVGYRFTMTIPNAMQSDTIIGVRSICSHLTLVGTGETYRTLSAYTITNRSELFMTLYSDTRLAGWKSYLAAQYAAGTPVTVWYVLATPETAVVNEPLMKIGNYADELHSTDAGITIPTARGSNTLTVDTDLQPSSMTISGHIK